MSTLLVLVCKSILVSPCGVLEYMNVHVSISLVETEPNMLHDVPLLENVQIFKHF